MCGASRLIFCHTKARSLYSQAPWGNQILRRGKWGMGKRESGKGAWACDKGIARFRPCGARQMALGALARPAATVRARLQSRIYRENGKSK